MNTLLFDRIIYNVNKIFSAIMNKIIGILSLSLSHNVENSFLSVEIVYS